MKKRVLAAALVVMATPIFARDRAVRQPARQRHRIVVEISNDMQIAWRWVAQLGSDRLQQLVDRLDDLGSVRLERER